MDLKQLFVLISVLDWIRYAEGCNVLGVSLCERVFTARTGTSQADFEAGNVPEVAHDQLRNVCSAFNVFSQCSAPYLLGCTHETRFLFQGIENVYDYVCNEGFQDHVEHHVCLGRFLDEGGLNICVDDLEDKLDSFHTITRRSLICRAINDAFKCVGNAISRACGTDAAYHQIELEVQHLKPYTEYFLCEITPVQLLTMTSTTTTTTISPHTESSASQNKGSEASDGGLSSGAMAGIVVIIILLILVGICTAFFVVRHRKKAQENQEDTRTIANQTFPSPGNIYQEVGASPPKYTDPLPAYTNNVYDVVKY